MPCSCGGMRRSGLTPSNIAIRQNQVLKTVRTLPSQLQRPTQPVEEPKEQLPQPRPQLQLQRSPQFFSGNLPSALRK
jgi:hypothetical protein